MFLLLLFHHPEFIEKNNAFLEVQLDIRSKQENYEREKVIKQNMQKLVNEVNNHYEKIAPLVEKGCFISRHSYEKIRYLMSFDLKQEFAVVPRCELPKLALDSSEAMYVQNITSNSTIYFFLNY